MNQIELDFQDDCYLPQLAHSIQKEINDTKARIDGILSPEEIEVLSDLVMKLSPIELARMNCNHILLALIK